MPAAGPAIATAELLAACIDALERPGLAPALDRWLTAEVGCDNVTMLAYAGHAPPQILHVSAAESRVHARIGSDYVAGAYLLDPFHQLHLEGAADGLYRLADIAPDHFSRSDYVLTYYQGTTLTDEIAYLARPRPGVTVTICLGRDASTRRRFGPGDLARAQAVAPVCLGLIRRHWAGLTDSPASAAPDVADALRANTAQRLGIDLTPRQAQVALMVLRGHSSASIALNLALSPETVKVFRKQLYRRCGIGTQAQLFSLLLPMLGLPAGR